MIYTVASEGKIMNHMTADQPLLDRLAGVMGPVEIRDADGKVLGRYTPVFADEKEVHERAAKYFDLAEAERIAATEREGYSIEEVMQHLHSLEKGE
ncbi:MAG TPA: hypothetical protein DDY78_06640 [Planctomycetales bacterium]|jgi:hypothetical protein|nr:hypothetical protein [Planctomycetales bacterium]